MKTTRWLASVGMILGALLAATPIGATDPTDPPPEDLVNAAFVRHVTALFLQDRGVDGLTWEDVGCAAPGPGTEWSGGCLHADRSVLVNMSGSPTFRSITVAESGQPAETFVLVSQDDPLVWRLVRQGSE